MFNSIRGTVTYKKNGILRILCSGIEWEFAVSSNTMQVFPEPGLEAKVFVYLLHKEDQMKLFGFPTEEDRSLFLDLLKVNGIGPRQAVKILSGVKSEELVPALESGDIDTLSRIPGVGKKTAQKILLTLQGKLTLSQDESAGTAAEVTEALVDMGFDRKKAALVVDAIIKDMSLRSADVLDHEQEIMKRAIIQLST